MSEKNTIWIKDWVEDDFSQKIEHAIVKAEERCALDFFPVVVKNSTPTGHVFPLLSLGLLLFFVTGFLALPYFKHLDLISGILGLSLVLIILLLLAYSLSQNILLGRFFTDRRDQDLSVEQASRLAYFEHGVDQHDSILIYISLLERRLVLLCNKKVQAKVKQEVFDQSIDRALPLLKQKKLQAMLAQCIEKLSLDLAQDFPLNSEKPKNKLSNTVLIKDD